MVCIKQSNNSNNESNLGYFMAKLYKIPLNKVMYLAHGFILSNLMAKLNEIIKIIFNLKLNG